MPRDRATVVAADLALVDQVGLDGLTLRRLAADLAVQAPALYWHFKNKQELLDEMASTMLARAVAAHGLGPEVAVYPDSWRDFATADGVGLREMLLQYRDGARVFAGTYLTDPTLFGSMELALATFQRAGFGLGEASRALTTVYSYTIGFCIEEQAVYPRPGERNPQYSLTARSLRLDPDRYPLSVAVGADIFANYAARYRYGLDLILRGVAALSAEAEAGTHQPHG
jgi:AcrR family transcriptional regulator